MKITQIISLPRCRTAWLSAAMTGGKCFAWHDAVGAGCSLADYHERLAMPKAEFAVDCSSGLLIRQDLIEQTDSDLIVIARDPAHCRASLLRHVECEAVVEAVWPLIMDGFKSALEKFKDRVRMIVDFSQLADTRTVEKVWQVCAPGQPFDWLRVERLQQLTITERKQQWHSRS